MKSACTRHSSSWPPPGCGEGSRILLALDDEDPDDGAADAPVPPCCLSDASRGATTTNGLAGSSQKSL
jgi:hypothetical protein